MSDELKRELAARKERLEAKVTEKVAEVKRSLGTRIGRGMMWSVGGLLLALALLFGVFAWYTGTPDFERRVKNELVKVLEDATGGRVELAKIHFDLWRLAVEADGLVIHGLEGPGEAPYLSVEKVLLQVKLFNFFSHVSGAGMSSHVSLNFLEVDRPQFHLMVDKDGKTNQPVPKHKSTSNTPVMDTLLDLKAREVLLRNGVALLNDKAIPFELAARDLDAEVHYLAATDRYGATVDLKDLRTKMAAQPEAQSELHVEAEVGRDAAEVKGLHLTTGKSTVLDARASLKRFAQPEWQVAAKGSVELKQITVMTNVEGLNGGAVDLDVKGHSCEAAPAVQEKKPSFWQRGKAKETAAKGAPADPDCVAGYLITGTAKIRKAGYWIENVHAHDVDGGLTLRATPEELLLSKITAVLPGGGNIAADLRIAGWLGTPVQEAAVAKTAEKSSTKAVATKAAAPVRAHAYLTAALTKVPLRTIMDITAPEDFGDLGFDTAVSGPVKVEWGGGAAKDIADTVEVDGDLMLLPTGVKRRRALNNTPITGRARAHYTGSNETVRIENVVLQMPQTNLETSGILGVNEGDRLTALRVDLTTRDLSEFDQLLTTLDLEANGKKGVAAIPVKLHGPLQFHGTTSGRIENLDVKGHLQAEQVEFALGSTDVALDSVVADAEYSPDSGVAIADSTIQHGGAALNVVGKIVPRKEVSARGVARYVWDSGMGVDATAKLTNAQVADVLQIAGQKGKVPLTGTISLNAHAAGTFANLKAGGHVSLVNGMAYGEPYESDVADVSVNGEDLEADNVVLKVHGMQVMGHGGYDLESKHLHGHIEGNNIRLSKFATIQNSKVSVDGVVSLVADANGTLTEPALKANLKVADVMYDGQPVGDATVEAHSEGKTLYFAANSALVGAKLNGSGQMQLTDDYRMQAKLTIAGLDVGRPLAMFGSSTVKASSLINGTVTVSGPLSTPKMLNGEAEFSQVDVKLQGIELKAAEPLRVGLHDGLATLEQVHITGQDTDMRASGTAELLGVTDPKGGRLDVKTTGNVSLALLHTFDPDLIASGKVEFTVAAGGRLSNPTVTGKVQFDDANLAMDGVPNGLSKLNGTLVFNDDRLQVQSLTARTGGGDLKIGGSIRYKNGLYADLTATGDAVRVRLYGLSTTANANLKLQGTQQSSVLSGTILITRFGIGQDVDLSAFSSAGGISEAPNPNSAANKIRLDVHVTSAPQLDFQNSYAKLAGTVDLTVRGTVAVPSILGRIEINDGSATFAGTKYQLQRGEIYFTNPVRIDPTIDLDVTAQVENYDITVGLHGTATNLKPTYRSEPPLSESDVFALLALGRTQEEAQINQERLVQQGTDPTTSALLGGALNATVSNRVEKLFGVGSVKIDPAFVGTLGDSSARITIQQQISRQITATFATNVNTSAQQLIQVQYDFNHDNALVVTRDESGVFSIVYKLRKRYR